MQEEEVRTGQSHQGCRPTEQAETAETAEATRIPNAAWQADEDWGAQIWLHITTGERRGEICVALQRFDLTWDEDADAASVDGTMQVERAITKTKTGWVEGPTQDHQQRRIVLDPETIAISREYRCRCEPWAAQAGFELAGDAFVFSPTADHRTFYKPDSITQRYGRLVARLEIVTSIHKLRHYSATELILGGRTTTLMAGHQPVGQSYLWDTLRSTLTPPDLNGRFPTARICSGPPWTAGLGQRRPDP
jgi:integrase